MNTNRTFIPSRGALIAQTCFFSITCLYPSAITFFMLIFQPHESTIPKDKTGMLVSAIIPPILLVVTIFGLRRHFWAILLSIAGQIGVSLFLIFGIIWLIRQPGDDFGAGLGVLILAPFTLVSMIISLVHGISIWKQKHV
ncbi:MAG: hypothetical protein PHD76_12745 [Methylacidiphilales bacterium]|nr:hypothetical protein [Candidatus Methylacidiphilales bacterium]